uniref:Uncharacterized protein n=1 Tax=Salarias fasciatus TaxID=181472 RepID=A0A672HJT0_SALFA
MMAPRVLFLLLQLCSLQVLLVSMTTRCHLTKHLVLSTYRHLEQLGEPFPLHCRSYNQNIYFPDDVVPAAQANRSQCQQVLRVLLESLQEAEPIFMENEFPDGEGRVNWDANKLEGFLIHQNRVLEEGQCVSRTGRTGESNYSPARSPTERCIMGCGQLTHAPHKHTRMHVLHTTCQTLPGSHLSSLASPWFLWNSYVVQ